MNLDKLIGDLEKSAAEIKPVGVQVAEKSLISQELDKVLTKQAATENAMSAFEVGQATAKLVLEKLAQEAVLAVPETEETPSPPDVQINSVEEEMQEKQAAVDQLVEAGLDWDTAVDLVKAAAEEIEAEAETTTESVSEPTEENMNKLAQDAGKQLAQEIVKEANRIISEEANLVAQHDARIRPTPGLNGTINNVFDAIVAKAKAMGTVGVDQGSGAAPGSSAEGADPAMGTPSIPPSPDVQVKSAEEEMQEKQAAVNELVEAGLDWDTAVDLVKAAAEEIEAEEFGQIKVAAVSQLMYEGFDFDSAVSAVQAATAPEQE